MLEQEYYRNHRRRQSRTIALILHLSHWAITLLEKQKTIMKMWRVLDNFLTNNIVHNTLFVEELATVDGNK